MASIQQQPPRTKKVVRDTTSGADSGSGSGIGNGSGGSSGSAGALAAESKKRKAVPKAKKKGETSGDAAVASAAGVDTKGKRKRPLAKVVGKKQQQQRENEEEDGEIFDDEDDDEQDNRYEDFDDDEEETKSNSQHSTGEGEGESKSNSENGGEQEEKAKPRRGRRRMLHDEEQRKMRRKNQCKLNQRRYRARQRGMISTLSLETDTLADYIHELEAYQQFLSKYKQNEADLSAAAHRGGSTEDLRPGLVVSQFFHFFSHGFALHSVEISDIQERFVRFISAPNLISQGATKAGVDALLLQLKRYTSYHAVFELHLDSRQVVHSPDQQQQSGDDGDDEEDKATSLSTSESTWVVQVSGRMHLRLSRDTVMLVYPHIVEDEALSYRVVGHEIDPPFSFVFQFNEHGKLCKLELMVDFTGAFMQLLSSTEQVATLLGRALISPHCELGIDPHEESAIDPESGRENKQLSLKFILL